MTQLTGPIIVIDDDVDDHEIITEVCARLGVVDQLKCFKFGEDALAYLQSSKDYPCIILCDVNMPVITGFQLRKTITANNVLRERSVPFIFYSTAADLFQVKEAYDMTVQGFFIKGSTLDESEKTFKVILDYWSLCKHPNSILR
jgi:CheY-like chemotaxis protein